MSYDISFKVKVEGVDEYVEIGNCDANITWNVRDIICKSTGLEWLNEANNGLCKDVIAKIAQGYSELLSHPEKYRQYESPNGYGTVENTRRFFKLILDNWETFCNDYNENLQNVVTFWIE